MNKKYTDTTLSPKERARMLLAELSLDEKMAQVNCIFPFEQLFYDDDYISQETKYGIGEVSTLELRRVETLEEAAAWQRKVQKIVMENSPHRIPAIFHMEGLCGAFIQDTTSFPSGIGRGSGWDPELEEEIAKIVSRQEAACGITHVLAPVLDISRDSRMGRQGETYGEDPVLASALGAAYTRGIQSGEHAGRKTESVAKHFLGFHNSQGGIHGSNSDTPPRMLQEIYGKPFQAAIAESDLKGVMPCYCTIDGEQVSASKHFLTNLLREEMGFEGVCFSDYGAVGGVYEVRGIGESAAEAGLMCMQAGMDIEAPNPTGYSEELKQMFASGEADMEVLDRAVLRVLEAKFRMGLFEHPFALEGEMLRRSVVRREDREVSLRSAKESLVLLKNDGVLPLKKGIRKIALIGPHGDCARKLFGGYTHLCMMESTFAAANSIAGVADSGESVERNVAAGASASGHTDERKVKVVPGTLVQSDETEVFDEILRRQKPDCRSLLEELRMKLPDTEIIYAYGYPVIGADESGFGEALEAVREADAVILTLGGKHGTCSMATMGEGVDASDINLPACQDSFIRRAAAFGKPMIGVHFNGRPISSDAADACLHAILEAWNPSECGAEAVAAALTGEYNPGGKMPVSVARNAGQIPIYYNHPNGSAWHQSGSIGFPDYVDLPHTPRYFFGHGLSYTTFAYSDLRISANEIMPGDSERISSGDSERISPEEPVRVTPEQSVGIEVTVKNTGNRAGDEVVQLYLRDAHASIARPVKELAGFLRISLEPGEEKRIGFQVAASQTAFLDTDMRWRIEKGRIDVEVGSSSEDIRLRGHYFIKNTAWTAGKERAFYAKADVVEG